MISVALVGEDELVHLGLAAMLGGGTHGVVLADRGAGTRVDIALYDPAVRRHDDLPVRLLSDPHIGRVAAYTWNYQPWLARDLERQGLSGFLSKTLTGPQLVKALKMVQAGGAFVLAPTVTRGQAATSHWPGRDCGLTVRESEVLALITRGMSNHDIAQHLHVSPNSVKSYIRSCYRKIGAESRSQAVIWGLSHALR